MNSPENRAMVLSTKSPGLVDSDNFIYYLGGASFLWGREQKFAPRLNLSLFTPYLRELYKESRLGDVFSEDSKNRMLSTAVGTTSNSPSQAVDAKYLEFINRQGEVERARTFYIDPPELSIKASEISFGEHTSVQGKTIGLLNDEKSPILEAHTHPTDSLPSAQDYWPLITRLYKDESIPVASAIIVACPNIQILALATRETPVMTLDDAKALWTEYDSPSEDEKQTRNTLMKRIKKVQNSITTTVDITKQALDYIRRQEQKMLADGQSEEAIVAMLKAAEKDFEKQLTLFQKKYGRNFERASQQFWNFFKISYNTRLIEFTRLINVKLYSSTNCRDFYEFSA